MFPGCQHILIGPVHDKTSMIPYEVVNGMTNSMAPPGNQYYFTGITRTHLTVQTAVAIHDHLLKMRASHPLLGGFAMVWLYYPMAQKIMSVKSDAMAFRMRTPDLGCLVAVKLDSSVQDEEVKAKAKELLTEHRLFCEKLIISQAGDVQRPESDKCAAYANYGKSTSPTRKRLPPLTWNYLEMADGRADVLFGANYPRLQSLKAKYDPNSVFSKWYPIEPSA